MDHSYVCRVITLYYMTIKHRRQLSINIETDILRFAKFYANVFGITNYRNPFIYSLLPTFILSRLYFYCLRSSRLKRLINCRELTLLLPGE